MVIWSQRNIESVLSRKALLSPGAPLASTSLPLPSSLPCGLCILNKGCLMWWLWMLWVVLPWHLPSFSESGKCYCKVGLVTGCTHSNERFRRTGKHLGFPLSVWFYTPLRLSFLPGAARREAFHLALLPIAAFWALILPPLAAIWGWHQGQF